MKQSEFNDQMNDILSSGDGEFESFHKRELTKLFNSIEQTKLKSLVTVYYNKTIKSADYTVMAGELKYVAAKLKTKLTISFD